MAGAFAVDTTTNNHDSLILFVTVLCYVSNKAPRALPADANVPCVLGRCQEPCAAHYADIDAHRAVREQAIEAGLTQALEVALPPPVVAHEHGRPLGWTPRR